MKTIFRTGQKLASTRQYLGLTAASSASRHASSQISDLGRSLVTVAMSGRDQEVTDLLGVLEKSCGGKKKTGLSVKKTTYQIKSSRDGIQLDSWRFQDWDYKKKELPTYARGLFTTKRKDGTPEIAVRGYDKFFNVGEVNDTRWENIVAQTKPPYDITLKENGCIIFIGGLEDGTLVVCSKHSTGDRVDGVSHASAGEARLEQQLAALGKSKEDFARELRKRNATAVAEFCDDSFEEHILAYGPDKAGLYLHGLNHNLPVFSTYSSPEVQKFAEQWGFRKIGLITMNDVQSVKAFLEKTAETGAHDGRDVEGFVIRCKMSRSPGNQPYSDWFFKYKFDEPYLMYRQWREVTKMMISGKEPKYKKHKLITGQYLDYARKRLSADPQLGKLYTLNHGIIALRDDFLRFKNLKGSDAADMDEKEDEVMPDTTGNVVLCPVATIGCGKTTCALALTKLFEWGHVQNDNITGKARPPRFTAAVLQQLKKYPVVFADRNNAEKRERNQIIGDLKKQDAKIKVVCIHYRHDDATMNKIRELTTERVRLRGNNHQTINTAMGQEKQEHIMDGFLKRYEPCEPWALPDSAFDLVIDLDPLVDSRVNLETVITRLHKVFPNLVKKVPSAQQLDDAIRAALDHKVHSQGRQPVAGDLEYMSVNVDSDAINTALKQAFGRVDAQTGEFFKQLEQTGRIQRDFHVTLMHRATSQQHPELWQRYKRAFETLQGADGKLGVCDVILERIVFDGRVMAMVVRLVDEEGKWPCVNRVAHITVGTLNKSIKPKESNDLLAKWLDEGAQEGQIQEVVFEQKPIIKGHVRAVQSRR
ncbi:hypothetical protein L249_5950 [Ophiocordyceps polyrhachis-furcata BCC 54312]|uniref:tRNA ligase n=1 Tax=Ophiocordyceps polyrhachis-furcata BCC 54312 TaxID=1330021 RepID=A0A367LIV8_9HYPO|nr:hypothetical protein L249_5950 [Ophiocordyceps polyrhachis-furcata BCC 54312]